MTREIEFRGQRIDNGEWVYGFLYQLPLPAGVGCMILTTDNTHEDNSIEPKYHLAFTLWVDLFPVKPYTVGEFTGLVDKNGVKIFEGDIVRIYDSDYEEYSDQQVKFAHGVFGVDNWTKKYLTTLSFFLTGGDSEYSVEVIGNIHDTK